MEYRTIGYSRVSHWCPDLKWGRRGLWWLDSRHDSEHNVRRRVERDKAGCLYQRQASRQLREFAQQASRRRRNGEVNLGSKCKTCYRCNQIRLVSRHRVHKSIARD
jgi:hypothetical protein